MGTIAPLDSPALKLSSIGFMSGEYGGRNFKMHPWPVGKWNGVQGVTGDRLLTLRFDDFSEDVGFVNLAVIKNQNALWTGVWIHGGQLSDKLGHISRVETSRTYHITDDEVKKFLRIDGTNEDARCNVTVHANRSQDAVALPSVEPSMRIRRSPFH